MKIFRYFLVLILACFGTFSSTSIAEITVQALPKVETYEELRTAVREAKEASRARIEHAVRQEKVREAWEIGKLIDTHVLHHKERADYGQYVIRKLSEDLGMSRVELYHMLEFARSYPRVSPARQLSWSHYRELLSVNDIQKREELAERAEKENWDRGRLRSELRKWRQEHTRSRREVLDKPLTADPGKLGTYRIVKATVGPHKGRLAVDLGFSNYHIPHKKLKFEAGDIVSPVSGKLVELKDASSEDLFTYHAYLIQVVDGDTFHALIDLGFGFMTTQTLRLRGLDAPEIESAEGREAKEWMEKMLSQNQGALVIKTSKSDKYDRYLADVWVGARYVNQELAANELAVVVSE